MNKLKIVSILIGLLFLLCDFSYAGDVNGTLRAPSSFLSKQETEFSEKKDRANAKELKKILLDELDRFKRDNIDPVIQRSSMIGTAKELLGGHIVPNTGEIMFTLSFIIEDGMMDEGTRKEWDGKEIKELLNRHMDMTKAFSNEESILGYAKINLQSDKSDRQSMGKEIISNQEFRKTFVNVMKDYLELLQTKKPRLFELIDYFDKRVVSIEQDLATNIGQKFSAGVTETGL